MPSVANITVHASQFPENVRRDLLESLRTRQVNHKFHYDSVKQTQQWLALHQAFSPSRNDTDCAAVYDRSFEAAAVRVEAARVHLIGLGCGGGQKDTRLLTLLKARGKTVFYTPCDVSTAMVLVARQAAASVIPESDCFPLVCDLATAEDLPAVLDASERSTCCEAVELSPSPGIAHPPPHEIRSSRRKEAHSISGKGSQSLLTSAATAHGFTPRLITFFGMLPNFEPQTILPKLAGLARPNDWLLFSANLAPGPDYAAGVRRVLPQYDNPLTRDWLLTFLLDLGVERGDGDLRFTVEDDPAGGVKRITASFHFKRSREIQVDAERFEFRAGETIRLFFSYRHTPALVRTLLDRHGLEVIGEWITKSAEEGVFLLRRK